MDDRSYSKIEIGHLEHLRDIAFRDQDDFFKRYPKYKHYEKARIAVLLVQGAALHFIGKGTGVNDFDLLVAYRKTEGKVRIYPRRLKSYESGLIEFGRSPKDPPRYQTRRVDILMRAIEIDDERDLLTNLSRFIGQHEYWNKKAAIGIWPKSILGKIVYEQEKKCGEEDSNPCRH